MSDTLAGQCRCVSCYVDAKPRVCMCGHTWPCVAMCVLAHVAHSAWLLAGIVHACRYSTRTTQDSMQNNAKCPAAQVYALNSKVCARFQAFVCTLPFAVLGALLDAVACACTCYPPPMWAVDWWCARTHGHALLIQLGMVRGAWLIPCTCISCILDCLTCPHNDCFTSAVAYHAQRQGSP